MTAPSFDPQAETFDRRAGLPAAAVEAVAAALSNWTSQGRVLEIGAGTGQLGVAIADNALYFGMDLSLALLAVARRRSPLPSRLLQANANHRWPFRDHSARVVFAARTAHLLDDEHFTTEVLRVVEPNGHLLLGRIERAEGSARRILQRALRGMLAERGIEARQGGSGQRKTIDALIRRGASASPRVLAASWSAPERPLDILESWRSKPGLAGRALPHEVQHRVLDRLEAWAREHMGPLDAARAGEAIYEITHVQLPAENR